MAMGTDVGDIYVEAHIDSNRLYGEAKRDAKIAASAYGSEFNKKLGQSVDFSDVGKRLRDNAKAQGGLAGNDFGDLMRDNVRRKVDAFHFDLAEGAVSGDWSKILKQFDSLEAATKGVNTELNTLYKRGKLTEAQWRDTTSSFDGFINGQKELANNTAMESLAKKTRKAADEMKRLRDSGDDAGKGLGARLKASMQKAFDSGPWSKKGKELGQAFSNGFGSGMGGGGGGGMDRTVKLVLTLIASLGPQMAALASTLSAPLVALLSSAIVGLSGALLSLGGPLAAAVLGMTLAISAMENMRKTIPGLNAAIGGIQKAWQAQANALGKEWGPALTTFLGALGQVLKAADFGKAIGGALSTVTTAFTGVLTSPGFTGFMQALTTSFPAAAASIGTGLAGVLQGLLSVFTAAAPLALQLTSAFSAWGTSFAATMATMAADGTLANFFAVAGQSITALMGLLNPLAQALGNVFLIGADSGNVMLEMLGGLASTFLAFTQSVQGQEAIGAWFAQAIPIFSSLMGLVGAVGTALATLVTPEALASVNNFIGALTSFMPTLTGILTTIGNLGLLDLVAQALTMIGDALAPVMPVLQQMAGILGSALSSALTAIMPLLSTLAGVFTMILSVAAPLIGQIIGALAPAFASLTPIISALAPLINALLPVFLILAEVIGALVPPIVSALLPVFKALQPVIETLVGVVGELAPILGGILLMAVEALAPVISAILPVISALLPVFVSLAEALTPVISQVLALVAPLVDALLPIIMALIPIVQGLLGPLIELAMAAFMPLLSVVLQLAPVLLPIIGLLSDLIVWILGLIKPIVPLIGFIIELVASFLSFSKVIGGLSKFVGKIGEAFGNLASKMIDGLSAGIKAVGSWFGGLPGKILNWMMEAGTTMLMVGQNIMVGLAKGLGMAVKLVFTAITTVVEKVIDFFKSMFGISSPSTVFADFGKNLLEGLINGLQSMLSAIGTFFSKLFTTMIDLVVKGITAYITFWVTLPGKIIAALATLLPMIGTFFAGLWTSMVEFVVAGITAYITFWVTLPGKIISAIATLLPMIGEFFAGLWTSMVEFVVAGITAYITFWLELPGKIISAIASLLTLIGTFFGEVFGKLGELVVTGITAYIKFWVELPGKIITAIGSLLSKIGTFFGTVFSKLATIVITGIVAYIRFWAELPGKIITAITSLLTKIGTFFGSVWTTVTKSVSDGIATVVKFFTELPGKIITGMGSLASKLIGAGGDLIDGFVKGIGDAGKKLVEAALRVAKKAVSAITDFLGISSPSKLFIFIGKQMTLGMALGIEDKKSLSTVVKALEKVNKTLADVQQLAIDERANQIIAARKAENQAIKVWNAHRGRNQKARVTLPSINLTEARKQASKEMAGFIGTMTKIQASILAQSKLTGLSLDDILPGLFLTGARAGTFAKGAKGEKATLADLAAAREEMADRIKEATKGLEEAIKIRDDFADKITASASKFASAMQAVSAASGKEFTSIDVVKEMQKRLDALKKFSAEVQSLREMGLDERTLQDIVEGGVESGGKLASALVSGGQQAVNEVNALQEQINAAAGELGTKTAGYFFQAGVDAAQGIIDGLQSKDKVLELAMETLAANLVTTFKKALGIKSPARAFIDPGVQIAAGIAKGVVAGRDKVDNALASVTTGTLGTPRGLTSIAGGTANLNRGVSRNVNVQPGAIVVNAATDNSEQVANAVLDQLVARWK